MTTLRSARSADVPALIELARRSWRFAFASAPAAFVHAKETRDFESAWYSKYWPTMTIAEDDGRLLGVAQTMGDEVNGLWVDPPAHGRGVGTLLLADAEHRIAAAGHARAWLTCSSLNAGGLRFYAARGYREIDRERLAREEGAVEWLVKLDRALPDRR